MPLSWNEIRNNALAFSREWGDASSESADAKSFWDAFFNVFGINRRRVALFEQRVPTLYGHGVIDLFWKGTLLVEHKSRGQNLDDAYEQAKVYLDSFAESDLPRYILVCDFARFRLYNLDEAGKPHQFLIQELHENVRHFAFIAGYQVQKLREQDPVNIAAAERMGELHDALEKSGYTGHQLEVYLVRLLFCLFADSTGIFQPQQFQIYIEDRTAKDGSDLGARLDSLFDALNTPPEKRSRHIDEQLAEFAYINGELFAENLRQAHFSRKLRKQLLQCCELNWSRISPAIFGSLFQSIMDKEARRNIGAHYTSEKNILKLINPLFMDELCAEFESVKRSKPKLAAFHEKLSALKFFDPACGCGNFLVIAYRELRMLELDVLRALHGKGKQAFDIKETVKVNVDQFYGIEIEEFPAQIARTAMWLVDHQMNTYATQKVGPYFVRIPLETAANIVHANALQIDWNDVVPAGEASYVMGNPPFIGRQHQSDEQKADLLACFRGARFAGRMDFVTAWYCKAADYIGKTGVKAAFVSTNSIAQGEQVGPLWNELRSRGALHIHFAHCSFKWSNEARNNAGVHCVIIGFGAKESQTKRLFAYEDVDGEPHEVKAKNINPYLLDAPDAFVESRAQPLCDVPPMVFGSMPNDGGNLLLSEDEKNALLAAEPRAKKWVKPFVNAHEFITSEPRYCLWLVDCEPHELDRMPKVLERVSAVKKYRENSQRESTRALAQTPALFGEIRQPKSEYLLVPRVTSPNRIYIPTGFIFPETICGDGNLQVSGATLYHFGVISSLMHMAWVRTVCGRLGSGYRYSAQIVYNNFPWPNPTEKQIEKIRECALQIRYARDRFTIANLKQLYNPKTMPRALLKAHQKLDRAVDRAYRKDPFQNETERVAFLFDLYRQYSAPMVPAARKKRGRKAGK